MKPDKNVERADVPGFDWRDKLDLAVRRIPLPVREWLTRLALLYLVLIGLLKLGLDLDFMMQWSGFLLSQTPLVIVISVAALALAVPVAAVLTMARLSMSPLSRGLAGVFVSMVRGIPLIVLLFFFFIALFPSGVGVPDRCLSGASSGSS